MRKWQRQEAKYHSKKVVVDNHTFDSKLEARRYGELKLLERVGEVRDLELQPIFELQPGFMDASGRRHRAITYRADFQYFDVREGRTIVEDVKGFRTQVFRLKEKMLLFKYPDLNFTVTT